MGIKIVIDNVQASERASILSNATIACSDAEFQVRDTILSGDASVLKDINVTEFCSELENRLSKMDSTSDEYHSLQDLFNSRKQSKKVFLQKLFKHILHFSEGAPQKILCKRYSTKSRISRFQSAWMGFVPLVHISPGRVGRYARRYGVNAVQPCRECYFKGISLPCGRRT